MRSRAPLLELALFCGDLDRSAAFLAALGFHCEPGPGEEDTTVDVDLGGTVMQLFAANEQCPVTRCQLGFQVPDTAVPRPEPPGDAGPGRATHPHRAARR